MQANAFLPCALIQLAKAKNAARTVAANNAGSETAATNKDAASTRLSAYPAHAKEENAEPTAAEVLAEHARKDKAALLTASASHAHAKERSAV